MADLFKFLKPKAHLAKNGFDLSRKHVFSSQAGMALPCLSLETVPGDHFEIDLAALSRTQTFNTAAFLRGKQRYDFFFVPYTQLWHPFNQFITQRTDKHSTNQKGHIFAPVIELSSLLRFIHSSIYEGSTLFRKIDFMNYDFADGAIRILDLLGYGDFRWLLSIEPDVLEDYLTMYIGKYVNVFRLAAYQHIWYDYYRNKYYDVDNTGGISVGNIYNGFGNYIYGFNFDDVDCGTFAQSQIIQSDQFLWNNSTPANADTVRMYNLLKLNYIQWKKDIYTTAMPSQQFGVVSSVSLGIGGDVTGPAAFDDASSSIFNASGTSGYIRAFSSGQLVTSSGVFDNTNLRVENPHTHQLPQDAISFDVLQLRKAEALQAWKQATLRAGNMTDSNFKAHFGVEPYYEGDENVRYLGSFSSSLQVNAVETTAQSSAAGNNRVGDLAATGTMVTNGQTIKFDCQDYGIVMCIASYLPESEYSSNALDKANTLHEQFDWFTPEFQNIGLEAVSRHEFDLSGQDTAVNDVVGFAPRYYMYKTAVDKVFGEFKDTESLYGQDSQDAPREASGTLEGWVSPRVEYSSGGSRLLRTFYVDPRLYDNVMAIQANAHQNTDYFLNNVFFDIKAIRPMSVLGLPQF